MLGRDLSPGHGPSHDLRHGSSHGPHHGPSHGPSHDPRRGLGLQALGELPVWGEAARKARVYELGVIIL